MCSTMKQNTKKGQNFLDKFLIFLIDAGEE